MTSASDGAHIHAGGPWQIWPPGRSLHTSDGIAFASTEPWEALQRRLHTTGGHRLLKQMAPEARSYVMSLIGIETNQDLLTWATGPDSRTHELQQGADELR